MPGPKVVFKTNQYSKGVKFLWDLWVIEMIQNAVLKDDIETAASVSAKSSLSF
jgi:hypothetical protein